VSDSEQMMPPTSVMPWQPIAAMPSIMKGRVGDQPVIFFTIHTPAGALTFAWPYEAAEQLESMLREARGGIQVVQGPSHLFIPGQ
jgi:hypothetical protein